jgi:predicted GIY-YIG superfamily endonuclease
MNEFIIYSISTNNEVFYIGRTSDFKRRKSEHLYEKKKTHKGNKINKLKRLGLPIEFNVLHKTDSFDTSVELEIREIKEHREAGVILTNLTDGGEGSLGHKPIFTDEWKAKLKASRKKLFDDGYEVANKGKTLEELIGVDKAEKQKKRIGKKISEGIKNGTRKHNKGVKIDDLVGVERAEELRKISSDNAKKIFTGSKQTNEQINKRALSSSLTKQNWSEEKRKEISEKYRLAQLKSVKTYNFIVDGFSHHGTWKSLSLALKEELSINVSPVSLSDFYRGKNKTLKCGIKSIIMTQSQ